MSADAKRIHDLVSALAMRSRLLFSVLRPSPRVPTTRWSASGSTWRASPASLAILALGLVVFGVGEGSLVAARLGNTPWTVLAQGIANRTPLDIGGATIAVSVLVLLGWVPLRQRPGLGTVANIVLIGLSLDLAAHLAPEPDRMHWRALQATAGIALVGLGSALYLTANLGPGPRDGWMTGIHRATGFGIASVRSTIEISVLVIGIALGGHAGAATLAFAILVGYVLAATLRLMAHLYGERPPAEAWATDP